MVFACRYCYSGCIEVKQPIALGTLDAARKYMLPLLEEGCREIAIKNLGPLTIWETYSCSVCQGDEVLLSHCRDYFRKSVTAVEEALAHASMLQIPNGVLLDFLQINDSDSEEDDRTSRAGIAISGMELFLACQSWAEAECGRQKIEPSGMNKRMVLGDCLFLIPFPLMFPSDIVNFVSPTDILTQEEKYNLLELSLMKPANSADLPAPKFLAPEQRFLLVLEQEIYARARSEISPFRQSTLQYNTVRFIPKKKVILSGIWIIPPENPPYSSMHEVLIKGNGQIIGNKSIAAEVVGKRGQRPKLLHLPLKPMLLSVQCRYSISVQQNGQQSLLDNRNPEAIALYKTLCYKVKAASHVKMEVVKQQTNECIAAFTARLI